MYFSRNIIIRLFIERPSYSTIHPIKKPECCGKKSKLHLLTLDLCGLFFGGKLMVGEPYLRAWPVKGVRLLACPKEALFGGRRPGLRHFALLHGHCLLALLSRSRSSPRPAACSTESRSRLCRPHQTRIEVRIKRPFLPSSVSSSNTNHVQNMEGYLNENSFYQSNSTQICF